MPIFKIVETTVGNVEKTRTGYIFAEDSDDAVRLAEEGNVTYHEEDINIYNEFVVLRSEQAKLN